MLLIHPFLPWITAVRPRRKRSRLWRHIDATWCSWRRPETPAPWPPRWRCRPPPASRPRRPGPRRSARCYRPQWAAECRRATTAPTDERWRSRWRAASAGGRRRQRWWPPAVSPPDWQVARCQSLYCRLRSDDSPLRRKAQVSEWVSRV